MIKLIAIANVIAWSGFWAFGYLALTADGLTQGQLVIAAILAFGGLIAGCATYMILARAAEASGYARKSNQLDAETRNRAQSKGTI
ncbi:hypothetical protein I5535_00660 [Rhodobacteraceae bacterium F11138]|nr:hypothetical protein [Rhodobacteraceae bacterium F11138]